MLEISEQIIRKLLSMNGILFMLFHSSL